MATRFTSLGVKGALVVAGLLTGATITATSLTSSNIEATGTLSGATLQVNSAVQGSGKLLIQGSSGAYICVRDSDSAGYSMIRALNGTLTTTIAGATMCP